ncbi:hypothetical protein SKAU_G00131280 [Synaphobranchus kaupii]|uniref:Uncharacterized protein n=1 Tax=Synaphobranchus kaupii TaxID=118154 RepID=A0A9Q1FQJ6_SYNKA|nr:hypothetical protein SKAU_G00131280 [Synaphobranchus kaupii]
MAYKQKKHRAMGDEEWMSRLRGFAALGVWPSEEGNRPAPRQKKWYDLKIEKCPMQLTGKTSLFGGTQTSFRLGPCVIFSDTTTRTLILFCITRSNIWSDSNTWANTFQAHFDVGIVYKATVRPSGPSAVTTSSASALPLPTTLTTTVSAAAATAASGAHAITPAAPQQQLTVYKHTAMPSGPSAVTTSSASALPLPTTLSATATTARPSGPPSMTPAAPEQQLAVDERSVPGMDRVDSLAEYLVGLRTETGQTLNNQQASTIIALWQNLLPYGQQRVAYAALLVRLKTGRFRCSKKKPDFTPGVESMTRCVLASTGSPAQWPNSCRLVESIFVKLCDIHKSPKKQGNYALTRWTLILRDYSKIRQLVLVPLASKYCRTAVVKRKSAALAQHPHPPPSVHPRLQAQRQLFPQQAPPPTSAPLPVVPDPTPVIGLFVFLTPQVPAAKLIAPAGPLVAPPPARRAYNRTVDQNKCIKCHQPRNKETSHSQYYGHIYCPQNTDMPLDQWLEKMRMKRAEKK